MPLQCKVFYNRPESIFHRSSVTATYLLGDMPFAITSAHGFRSVDGADEKFYLRDMFICEGKSDEERFCTFGCSSANLQKVSTGDCSAVGFLSERVLEEKYVHLGSDILFVPQSVQKQKIIDLRNSGELQSVKVYNGGNRASLYGQIVFIVFGHTRDVVIGHISAVDCSVNTHVQIGETQRSFLYYNAYQVEVENYRSRPGDSGSAVLVVEEEEVQLLAMFSSAQIDDGTEGPQTCYALPADYGVARLQHKARNEVLIPRRTLDEILHCHELEEIMSNSVRVSQQMCSITSDFNASK